MNGMYQIGDTVLEKWKLVTLLGSGSYGRVYEAHREDFGMVYKSAIKIITVPQSDAEVKNAIAEGMDDKSVTAYFRDIVKDVIHEFELMSRLKGTSNIVNYEDHEVIEHSSGRGWDIIIRMELLTPLLDYTMSHPLSVSEVVKLGIDLCHGLELCERYKIIHRDIKPENIFISEIGDYKLGDFGISRTVEKATRGLSKKGTYSYMAPEVFKEQPYDQTVDIYSLGLVMYRLLNDNRLPFLPQYPMAILHSNREEAMIKRITGEPLAPPRNADENLARFVLKACAYQPKDRYQTAREMRADLEKFFRLYSLEEEKIQEISPAQIVHEQAFENAFNESDEVDPTVSINFIALRSKLSEADQGDESEEPISQSHDDNHQDHGDAVSADPTANKEVQSDKDASEDEGINRNRGKDKKHSKTPKAIICVVLFALVVVPLIVFIGGQLVRPKLLLAGKEYSFPLDATDLLNDGWSLEGRAPFSLNGGRSSTVHLQKANYRISVTFRNDASEVKVYNQCLISKVECYDSSAAFLIGGKKYTVGMSLDDVSTGRFEKAGLSYVYGYGNVKLYLYYGNYVTIIRLSCSLD